MVAIEDKSLIKFELVRDLDLNSLHEVSTLAYYQTYFGPYSYNELRPYLESFFSLETLAKEISSNSQEYFLVRKSGRAIGFSHLKHFTSFENGVRRNSENSAELFKLYLLQKYTGKGIGTRFMQMMERYYSSLGFRNLYSTVWSLSPKALRFYRKQGFDIIGETDYEYAGKGNIDYIMRKVITPSSDRML